MPITKLDHFNVRTTDLPATLHFYADVLGLTSGYRPPFPFPGVWMYIGDQPVVHIACLDPGCEPGSGRVNHVAFFADEIDSVRARIDAEGYKYNERTVPDQRLRQIFVRDPNGVTVELNFNI